MCVCVCVINICACMQLVHVQIFSFYVYFKTILNRIKQYFAIHQPVLIYLLINGSSIILTAQC